MYCMGSEEKVRKSDKQLKGFLAGIKITTELLAYFFITNNTWKAIPNNSWGPPIAADSLKWAQHELGIAFFSLSALFSSMMFTT